MPTSETKRIALNDIDSNFNVFPSVGDRMIRLLAIFLDTQIDSQMRIHVYIPVEEFYNRSENIIQPCGF